MTILTSVSFPRALTHWAHRWDRNTCASQKNQSHLAKVGYSFCFVCLCSKSLKLMMSKGYVRQREQSLQLCNCQHIHLGHLLVKKNFFLSKNKKNKNFISFLKIPYNMLLLFKKSSLTQRWDPALKNKIFLEHIYWLNGTAYPSLARVTTNNLNTSPNRKFSCMSNVLDFPRLTEPGMGVLSQARRTRPPLYKLYSANLLKVQSFNFG